MADSQDALLSGGSKMPPWTMPAPMDSTMDFWERFFPLKIMNSLTRKKERFVPQHGNRVLWYMCGPTVYDSSHMGHARTYVQFDVLRRIMTEIFGYDVVVCMNITDIDDKIIIRAGERKVHFRELAAENEASFLEDMKSLGVLPPHIMTRVSEYVPDIVAYIEEIIKRGYAYDSNGSVYFDVKRFNGDRGHVYGKLLPEGLGNAELLREGEGALSLGHSDKRGKNDFALWKKSQPPKEGHPPEPAWDSPWGSGRPGWHIECSVMASHSFQELSGGTMDIHSGGVDLRFPHHENEIAQAEAKLDCHQWVNYFLHAGHLHIKGFKMSKSLKNFITIREALNTHTARQIRFCFLLHKYNAPMDYGDSTMSHALSVEKVFSEFFHNVKALIRRSGFTGPQRFDPQEKGLFLKLQQTKADVRRYLADDFDIPGAIGSMQELVRESNKYLESATPGTLLLRSVAEYITSIFQTLGLMGAGDIGFGIAADSNGGVAAGGASREDVLTPFLDALTTFRESVRVAARTGEKKDVMMVCDALRDQTLPLLGVRLEDHDAGSIWKLEDPAVLAREREQKEAEARRKAQEKAEKERLAAEKEAKARIPPNEFFRLQKNEDGTDKFSQFDEDGVPTMEAGSTEPLSKGALKKYKKEWEAQKKAHEKYLAKTKPDS